MAGLESPFHKNLCSCLDNFDLRKRQGETFETLSAKAARLILRRHLVKAIFSPSEAEILSEFGQVEKILGVTPPARAQSSGESAILLYYLLNGRECRE